MFKSKKSVALLCALTLMASVPEIAFAKTPKPTLAQIAAAKAAEIAKQSAAAAAQSKLNSATKTLRQLSALADAAAARYRKAQADLVVAIAQAHTAAAHYAIAQASVSQANKTIGRMAQNAYIMGSGFTDLESVLHATGPQDLMDRLSTLNSLGANNSAALARFKAASIVAQAAKVEADRTKAAQVVATNQVAATKKAADDSKAIQQKEVNRLMAVQNQLAKELANARNVRITLEQQRQLALLEEASAAKAAVTPNQYRVWGGTFKGRTTIRSTDSIRAAAVAYATKQVKARKPYVWGAQGPNSFDCSGLVYAAYKAAGLGYPNWSRLNAALYFVDTQRVPLSQLVPGDLLFYSYDGSVQNIHHITIYAGNGKMWEANSTKAGLLFSDMYSIKGLMPSGGRV
ncbi:MAG: NlpC/P60 family protein [Actinomycetes bacterium]